MANITERAAQARLHLFIQGAADRAKGVARDCRRDTRYPSDHILGWRTTEEHCEWQMGWDATDNALKGV